MAFVYAPCTEIIFRQLALPHRLARSDRLNPIGKNLIYDLRAQCALIAHPHHFSEYPDRALSLYVEGRHYAARESIRAGDDERIDIWIEPHASDDERYEAVNLLVSAVALLRGEAPGEIPVAVHRSWLYMNGAFNPASRQGPRTALS